MICKTEHLPFFKEFKDEELRFFTKGLDLLINDENPKSFKVFLSHIKDDLKQLYNILEFAGKHKREGIMDLVTFSKLDKYDRGFIKGSEVYSAIIRYKNTNKILNYLPSIKNILTNNELPSDKLVLNELRNFTKYLCVYSQRLQ